ncbi:MAG: peptidoglycan recognition family protein [Planctomycetota bacterium]
MSHSPRCAPLAALALLVACSSDKPAFAPEILPVEINESIVACGERLYVGAPVVLWDDSNGYSAYSTQLHFERPPVTTRTPLSGDLRYQPGRIDRQTQDVLVEPDTGELVALQRCLDMFVVHYDARGTSQTCFKVLHDRRGLSVHFMIDVDGTIYQTLDLRDTAWHASQTNTRSVGVEIAQIGAYPLTPSGDRTLGSWYADSGESVRLVLPKSPKELGVLTPGFEGRPARPSKIVGEVQGEMLQQYDFTPEQYDSLVKLTATLCRHFPLIEPSAPTDARGRVTTVRLSEQEEAEFRGIVGHYHVSSQKTDPGPAFDWKTFLTKVNLRMTRL